MGRFSAAAQTFFEKTHIFATWARLFTSNEQNNQ